MKKNTFPIMIAVAVAGVICLLSGDIFRNEPTSLFWLARQNLLFFTWAWRFMFSQHDINPGGGVRRQPIY